MKVALDLFDRNISRVRDLGGMYVALRATTTGALDLTDVLRAQLVLAVSAFDAYVHDLVRIGMLQVDGGNRPATAAFLKFQISFDAIHRAKAGVSTWLEDEVRHKHGFLTFQTPDKVADALRLVTGKHLWDEVGKQLGRSTLDVKNELQLIVERRNKIAHEADSDPSFPGARWPIDTVLVNRAVDFLEQVARAIFAIL